MIEHAWTVICEKSMIDSDTGNMSLDVLDQVNLRGPLPGGSGVFRVPQRVDLVSLWYRSEATQKESTQATIDLLDRAGNSLSQVKLTIAFDKELRLRTRHILPNLPITGPGTYQFVVTLMQGRKKSVVASIPIEISQT